MTPEIIARVDAWLEKRSTPAWLSRWRHMTSARGLALLSGRTDEAATAEAAMIGIAFSLVQVAWGGGCFVHIDHVDDDGSDAVQVLVSRADEILCYPDAPTLGEALVAALEAAP